MNTRQEVTPGGRAEDGPRDQGRTHPAQRLRMPHIGYLLLAMLIALVIWLYRAHIAGG